MPKFPLFLTLGLTVSISCARADLVAHYSLDETGAETTVTDSFGLNHGTLISPGDVTKGFAAPHGTGYDFALRGGANLGSASEVRPSDQFTITWWFRATTLNAFDRLYESLSGTGNDGRGIRIDLGGNPGNRIRCLLRDGNGSSNTTVQSPTISPNVWYFFALRYDSLDGSAKLTVLQDTGGDITAANIASATTTNTSLGTNAITHANGAFVAADDAGASGGNDFGGAMDDIAFFQTGDTFGVLSDADLAEVYNNGALAFDPPAPKPTVNSFTADSSDVTSGTDVTLSWDVAEADSVEIDQGIGAVANPTGNTVINATLTKVYTLTATNAEGSTTRTLQITVDGQPLPPEISEFVASNSSFEDGDGNSPDWIEIHNGNVSPFDLSGYYLTDDAGNLQKWAFPAGTTLAGDEYLVVFASGQPTGDYTDAAGNLHTNFNLNANGEYLALVAPDGTIIQEFAPGFPGQKTDASYSAAGFLLEPTPGAPNVGSAQQGFVADTTFDVDRGFFTAPFEVNIATDTPAAEIYYTTDGSAPSPQNGTLFSAPINITTTTVLRAAAFKDNFIPTNVDTQTYLFLGDVLAQPQTPPGMPATWAGRLADYEMDPDIVNSPAYRDEMIPSLQTYATLSIAIDPADFFGASGIYQNPQSQGSAWERPVSAELIVHDGSEPGFQIDAGLRIQGGSSRNPDTPKHSLSLRFRNDYGAGKLRYDLYDEAPFGDSATDRFDFLQLRSGYNYGWVHRHWYQAENAQYARDQFANDLFVAMGNVGTHGRWIHLYINGLYWGIYHLHERPDSNFMAAYFGGNNDDYDAINSNRATDGTTTAYNAMAAVAANNIANPANYETLKEHLDVGSFIDYMLMNFFVGNQDWDGHNWRAAGQGPGGVPFHFYPWDSEICISPFGGGRFDPPTPVEQSLTSNVTGKNGNNRPTGIHQDLTTNAEYRLQFADHAHRHMFNGGPLSPEGAAAIWNTRADKMWTGIVAESARWGDYRFDVQQAANWPQSAYARYHRDDQYLSHKNWITGTYLPQRTAIVLGQLRARNLYPSIDAPTYSQAASTLTISNPNGSGTVYFTLDGSDPRDPDNPNTPRGTAYGAPLDLAASARVNSRVLVGTTWSALQSLEVFVGTPADSTNLTVSEIHYNPPGQLEDGEFLELTNISGGEIDLSKVSFGAGLTYTFPLGTTLPAGAMIVITPAEYSGNLDNTGETITINAADGGVIESFTYNDKFPWPEAADGDGFSLVRISPPAKLDPDLPSSWRASTTAGGNPGSSDTTTFPGGDAGALLDYAFGSRPIEAHADGETLTFFQNLAADDLIYSVEHSGDLVTWTSSGTLVASGAPDSGFSLKTFALPAAEPPRTHRFFRVRVQLR